MRSICTVAIGFTLCCVAVGALSADRVRTSEVIKYNNPARMFFEHFAPDPKKKGVVWWEGGNIVPTRRITEKEKDFFFDEVTSERLRDCSDSKYRCVYGLYRVFAVPLMDSIPN